MEQYKVMCSLGYLEKRVGMLLGGKLLGFIEGC